MKKQKINIVIHMPENVEEIVNRINEFRLDKIEVQVNRKSLRKQVLERSL